MEIKKSSASAPAAAKAAPTAGAAAGKSIAELKAQFDGFVPAIKAIITKEYGHYGMPQEEKAKVRKLYLQAANTAKEIARVIETELPASCPETEPEKHSPDYAIYSKFKAEIEEREKWLANSKKLTKKAQEYGSSVNGEIPKVTFDDVKGMEDVKAMMKSFMFLIEHPEIREHYKIKGGFGMLMYGAPGTGKTMFAKAIANAMQLPLFIVTPADIFKSLVGASEAAVKQLFDEIDACPEGAVLFFDECESIFTRRSDNTQEYKSAVTTELLQRMDGFGGGGEGKRIMIAATNRPDIIDPAYLRYKRFSHLVHVTPLDNTAKEALIASKLSGIDLEPGLTIKDILAMSNRTKTVTYPDLGTVEEPMGYYSAADLTGIIEEACRLTIEDMMAKGITTFQPITRATFEKAFEGTPPSISQKVLDEYVNFNVDASLGVGSKK